MYDDAKNYFAAAFLNNGNVGHDNSGKHMNGMLGQSLRGIKVQG